MNSTVGTWEKTTKNRNRYLKNCETVSIFLEEKRKGDSMVLSTRIATGGKGGERKVFAGV